MAFLSKIGSFVKPFVGNVIKAVAPKAMEALKGIVGNGIQSLFEAGTKGLSGLLSKLPIVGPLASNLLNKYAPGLADIAKNFVNGGLDKLLSLITGQPTSRPVPGAAPGTNVVTPPIQDRTTSIVNNTPRPPAAPSSGSNASTGGTGSAPSTGGSIGSGAVGSGGFPAYPTPPSDPKDLAAQNKFQEDMFKFQQASQNMNMFWQMMQNTLKSMGDTANNAVRNLR